MSPRPANRATAPVAARADGVDARPADHRDAPAVGRPGPQRRERVVVAAASRPPSPPRAVRASRARASSRGQVDPGEAADGESATGIARRRPTAGLGTRADQPAEPVQRRPRAPTAWCDVVGPRTAASSVAVGRDERDVRLRVAAVDGEERGPLTRRTARARRSRTNVAPAARRPSMIARQRVERARRPGVEQDDRAVADRPARGASASAAIAGAGPRTAPSPRARRRRRCRGSRAPPAAEHARVVGARPERAAEPRPRVHAGDVADRRLGVADVGREPVVGQERHPGVVEAVVADEVAVVGDPPGERGIGLDPAALEEQRRRGRRAAASTSSSAAVDARPVRPVGMLGVERQRDPERATARRRSLLHAGDRRCRGEDPLEDEEQDHRDDHRHQRPGLDVGRVPVVDAVEPLAGRPRAAGARASSRGRSAARRSRSTSRRGGRSRRR